MDAHGTLALNGGTLNIAPGSLTGTGVANFGGGTLKFSPDLTTTFTDNFSGGTLAAGTISTIDASTRLLDWPMSFLPVR